MFKSWSHDGYLVHNSASFKENNILVFADEIKL